MKNLKNWFDKYFMSILLTSGTVILCVVTAFFASVANSIMPEIFLAYVLEIAMAVVFGVSAKKGQKVFVKCCFFCFAALMAFLLLLGVKIGFDHTNKIVITVLSGLLAFAFVYVVLEIFEVCKNAYREVLERKEEIPIAFADAEDGEDD